MCIGRYGQPDKRYTALNECTSKGCPSSGPFYNITDIPNYLSIIGLYPRFLYLCTQIKTLPQYGSYQTHEHSKKD